VDERRGYHQLRWRAARTAPAGRDGHFRPLAHINPSWTALVNTTAFSEICSKATARLVVQLCVLDVPSHGCIDLLELRSMLRFVVLVPFFALLTGCGWGVGHLNNKDQRAPLERAAQEGNAAEVKRLLASGVNPNDRGGLFGSPLTAAALREDNVEVIRILLAAGANPNGRGKEGDRCWAEPLSNSASMGAIENTRVLLDAGASINQPRCSTLTVGWLKAPIVDLLVAHGLNLNAVDENGRNELHLALAPPLVAPLEGIEYLVRAGVPLNARDRWGKTPLAYWREPRYCEIHWFGTWLTERVSGDPDLRREREDRVRISAFLARSGAIL
jgi:hypothetical protein